MLLVNCNGTVVNANAIALEMFEAPGTALVGRGLLDLLPTFDSKRIPGSMRRRDEEVEGRTKPTRMVARRTDGTELAVEVTSANLEDGRTPYESAFEAAYADHRNGYTGDELLMLVVRDLSGTLDTEAELARQQRQTEMILRAAAEGVVGVDSEGRVVLVNPSAAQILGYRASELGGKELHPLIHHSRADGSALPWEDTPLADTLKSGRKHRVRGQVLWAKDGRAVAVDLTTAPVRDGDQLVGAVMTFTDRRPLDALAARHDQLLAVLARSLRGPLEELSGELTTLASDPAGQLWPEANQILHHLAAGHARMTALVDNVLSYQRLDSGQEKLNRTRVSLDQVVAAGVEGAVELIGPGRAQFAVHAPPIAALVDPERLAQALSHLIADVAGVDSTGRTAAVEGAPVGAGGRPVPGDSTIVVAAAKRGQVVRIEVRGPFGGGDPVHGPIVRGIVRMHDGLIQTHKVPGGSGARGSAYVLELPVLVEDEEPADGAAADGAAADGSAVGDSAAGGAAAGGGTAGGPGDGPSAGKAAGGDAAGGKALAGGGAEGVVPGAGGPGGAVAPAGAGNGTGGGGRRRARHSGPAQGPAADGTQGAGLPLGAAGAEAVPPSGRRRARQVPEGAAPEGAARGGAAPGGAALPALPAGAGGGGPAGGAGRGPGHGLTPALGRVPVPAQGQNQVQGQQAGRPQGAGAAPATVPVPAQGHGPQPGQLGQPGQPGQPPHGAVPVPAQGQRPGQPGQPQGPVPVPTGGRRARRALAEAPERAGAAGESGEAGAAAPRAPFALPPAAADRTPQPQAGQQAPALPAISGGMPVRAADGTPEPAGTGRRRARRPVAGGPQAAPGNDPANGPANGPANAPADLPGAHPVPAAGDTADFPGAQGVQGAWDAGSAGPAGRRARRAAAEERAAAAMADSEASGTFVAGPEGLVAQPAEPAGPPATGTTGPGAGTGAGTAPAGTATGTATGAPTGTSTGGAPGMPATPGTPPGAPGAPAPTGRRRGRPSPAEEAAA
ncbi:hypothetical protein ADL22_09965, partial [Streptomyces sp. NRRL F-4489]